MSVDLDELKRLAREAPPTHMTTIALTAESHLEWVAGAAFLKAANPAAVLALIERVERAEADNAALLDVIKELADLMEGVRDGSYTPDSFTIQPAERALSSKHPGAALLERMKELEGEK